MESAQRSERAAPILGVIEGFYGRPWSWPARHRMVDFVAPLGYAMYVYAPKDDPLHRLLWRERHLPEELDRFESFAARCRSLAIEFVFGIHPLGLGAEANDTDQLTAKARQLQAIGITSFCLLFDDLPAGAGRTDAQRSASARRHAAVANRLLARLRQSGECRRLMVAPTEYHGNRRRSAYLRALGQALAPEVDVFWTGPDVCSPTITGADVDRLAAELGRAPFIWDNYPVNDMHMRDDPHLRPIRGRSADLKPRIRGLVANPATQAEASHVALHTLAAWWADPSAYEPDAAWTAALRAVAGGRAAADALRTLADLARSSPLEPGPHPVAALDEFLAAPPLTAAQREAKRQLRATIGAWRRVAELLLGNQVNRQLRTELAPWARKLHSWSGAVEAALAGLPPGADSDASRRHALRLLAAARRNPARVADEEMDGFVRRLLWLGVPEDRSDDEAEGAA